MLSEWLPQPMAPQVPSAGLPAVALNDALTAYYDSNRRIYLAARDVGITYEQWQAIKHGDG